MDGYLVYSDARSSYLELSRADQRLWFGAGAAIHATVFTLAEADRRVMEQRLNGVPDARVVLDYYGRQVERIEAQGAA